MSTPIELDRTKAQIPSANLRTLTKTSATLNHLASALLTLTTVSVLGYFEWVFGRLIVILVLCVLLPASAADAFLHLHDDPGHDHHAGQTVSRGLLHTHVETCAPADQSDAFRADSGEDHSKARFANLFRFVPAAPVIPVFDLGPVQLLPDPGRSSSRLVELIPSAHDPPLLTCSIPRSPPA